MRIRGNVHFDSFATKKTEQIFVQILCAEQYVEAGAESAVRRRVLDVRSANDIWFIQFTSISSRHDDCRSSRLQPRDVVSCLRRRRGRRPVTVMADNGTRSTYGVVDTVGWMPWRRHPLTRLRLRLLLIRLGLPTVTSRDPSHTHTHIMHPNGLVLSFLDTRYARLGYMSQVSFNLVNISE